MIYSDMLSFGGATLCGLVGVKLFATVANTLQRYSADKTRFRLRNAALESELQRLGRVAVDTGNQLAWEGFRKFRVHAKRPEIDGCHSIYLAPHDGKPLPKFHPGQFLTFSVRVPGQSKPVVRCYSLSDAPNGVFYRCTVKKVPPRSEGMDPGIVSTYFNDRLKKGDLLDVKAPRGGFYLDMTRETPVVLIAGGVGITPLLSMMNTIAASSSRRTAHLFCGFRNGEDHLFKEHLAMLNENYENIHIHTAYSRPSSTDVLGKDYQAKGYVSLELLQSKLPSNNFEYYSCGPPAFMSSVDGMLKNWGVPADSIHSEAFGPASIKKKTPAPNEPVMKSVANVNVAFSRSRVTVPWVKECETLLDLAEKHNIAVDSGCRAGNCGTCAVAIKKGAVTYTQTPDIDVEDGSCLTCIAAPSENVELDA